MLEILIVLSNLRSIEVAIGLLLIYLTSSFDVLKILVFKLFKGFPREFPLRKMILSTDSVSANHY
jgi:hypothetical protein